MRCLAKARAELGATGYGIGEFRFGAKDYETWHRWFSEKLAADPDCAMAYWGIMMANVNNEKRAAEFAKEAAKRRTQELMTMQLVPRSSTGEMSPASPAGARFPGAVGTVNCATGAHGKA